MIHKKVGAKMKDNDLANVRWLQMSILHKFGTIIGTNVTFCLITWNTHIRSLGFKSHYNKSITIFKTFGLH